MAESTFRVLTLPWESTSVKVYVEREDGESAWVRLLAPDERQIAVPFPVRKAWLA
jgi:hypothetical protein